MTDGHFGNWTVDGPMLTLEEVRELPEETEVEIIWSGGNGPHRYVLLKQHGELYAWAKSIDHNDQLRYYNPIGTFVGLERYHTRIKRVA